MLVIRAFNTQDFELKRFDEANKDLTATNLYVTRIMMLMMPVMMLIMNFVTVIIVWVGAKQVSSFQMNLGDMMCLYAICHANYYGLSDDVHHVHYGSQSFCLSGKDCRSPADPGQHS